MFVKMLEILEWVHVGDVGYIWSIEYGYEFSNQEFEENAIASFVNIFLRFHSHWFFRKDELDAVPS